MEPLLLIGVGMVAGLVNAMAGGGSFLTLPLLIFLGLPATVANGTNRVAVIVQSAGALWGFHRWASIDWRFAVTAAGPATIGAVLGVWAALAIDDRFFMKTLSVLMIAVSLGMLWSPSLYDHRSPPISTRRHGGLVQVLFFLIGLYGGFVQAGVGFLILALTSFVGLDLLQGNAIKVFIVSIFTLVSLALFAWNGAVDWSLACLLAIGTAMGGILGARLSIRLGTQWLAWIVTAAVCVSAVALWLKD